MIVQPRKRDGHRLALSALLVYGLSGGGVAFLSPIAQVAAQVMGDEAELDRLKGKAEDALANEDAEGAAMSMGRAALMAAHLARREADTGRAQLFKGLEHLFRSQEHGYRAMALFRRAGGSLPASAGVCGSLQLGELELQHTKTSVEQLSSAPEQSPAARLTALRQGVEEWGTVLAAIRTDYQCVQ